MNLPKFTEIQQKFVVYNLIRLHPHRLIAREFREQYPDFVPDGMDNQAYEDAFIKRCKDYVSNKNRKWYQIIQRGRENYRNMVLRLVERKLVDIIIFVQQNGHFLDAKEAKTLADITREMQKLTDKMIYGEEAEDNVTYADDKADDVLLDDNFNNAFISAIYNMLVDDDDTYAEITEPRPLQDINDTDTIETV